MKKIVVLILFLVNVTSSIAFAIGEERVSSVARKTFDKEFPNAQFVKWDKVENTDLFQVRFVYNDQALLGYIHEDGSLLATARNIKRENLPFRVSETLSRKFSDSEIIQIEELTTASEVSYFFTLENEKSQSYVRVFNNGSYSELKKIKKKVVAAMAKK